MSSFRPVLSSALIALVCILFSPTLLKAQRSRPHNSDQNLARFVENNGQWDQNILYKLRFRTGALFLEKNQFTYSFISDEDFEKIYDHHHADDNHSGTYPSFPIHGHAFAVHFQNSNPSATVSGTNTFSYHENYFIGNDSEKWASNVSVHNTIGYSDLYPGINLSVSGENGHVKYGFEVAANADPSLIRLKFDGIDNIYVANDRLHYVTSVNHIYEQKPYCYQFINGQKVSVPAKFVVDDGIVTFDFLNGYDTNEPLVIDPVLVFASFTGSLADNFGYTATYDNSGNFYAGGIARAAGYPTTVGAFQGFYAGGVTVGNFDLGFNADIAISKFTSDGTNLLYSTYLGGSTNDQPHSLFVDDNDQLHVHGRSNSTNFPTSGNAYDISHNGGMDIIVTKFSATGSSLLGSTYIGGNDDDGTNISPGPFVRNSLKFNYADDARGDILVDSNGDIYVASCTQSSNFPTTSGAFQTISGGAQDGCIIKLNSNLSSLTWSSYIGGNGDDAAYSLALDNQNNLYTCGGTVSSNFPATSGSLNTTFQGGQADGFVAKISNNGSSILNASYLGTTSYDQAFFVQLDGDDNVYLYGQTSGSFPVTGGVYSNANSGQFIISLNPDLTATNFSTVFGRSDGDPDISPTAFLVDQCRNIYISGWGGSVNNSSLNWSTFGLPTTNDAFQSTTDGSDFYFAVFNPNASDLQYATFFGGPISTEHVDGGTSRFDKRGVIYQAVCAGCGGNSDFPTTPGAWSNTNNSQNPNINCNLGAAKFEFQLIGVEVDIEANPDTSGCSPFTVDFAANSVNAKEFYWVLGDGNTSTDSSFTHTYNTPGTYSVTLIGIDSTSCDALSFADTATATVIVFANPIASVTPDVEICDGQSTMLTASGGATYLWSNNQQTAAITVSPATTTTYSVTVTNANGCSDTAVVTVTVSPNLASTTSVEICDGESYFVGGGNQTASGAYLDTFLTATGCDSVVTTILTLKPNSSVSLNVEICQGEMHFAGGQQQSSTGTYYDTLNAANGCDSVVTTNLTVLDVPTTTIAPSICPGETFQIGNSVYSNSGSYSDTLVADNNCDSIVFTNLTVLSESLTNLPVTICDGESHFAGGSLQTQPGLYYDTLGAANGCDSVIVTDLSVLPNVTSTVFVSICDGESHLAGGQQQSTAGNYFDTLTASNGCDSIVTTELEVLPVITVSIDTSLCIGQSINVGNSTYSSTGNYVDTLTGTNGCDSIITLNLTINPAPVVTVNPNICVGESYFAGGNNQTTSGTYYDTLSTTEGCDSIIVTNLTVFNNSIDTVSISFCGNSDSVFVGGGWQTNPGTYVDTFGNSSGCDSIVVTELFIMQLDLSSVDASCSSNESECPCEGKMRNLTVQYIGQNGADVKVYNDDNGGVQLASFQNVQNGDILYVDAAAIGGQFKARTYFNIVGGNQADIHTSCSQDILGLTIGDFLVVGYTDGDGNECGGVTCDGSAEVQVVGGVAPYTYEWSDGSNTSAVSGLCPGTYTITVNDSSGCAIVDTVIIGERIPFSLSLTTTDAACGSSNSSSCECDGKMQNLTVQYVGQSGVDIQVFNDDNHSILIESFSNVQNGDILYVDADTLGGQFKSRTYFTIVGGAEIDLHTSCSQDIQGLTIGDYYVISYTDGAGNICNNVLCDGTAEVVVTGGTQPIEITWSTGDTVGLVTNLCAGTYTVTVSDSSGCSVVETVVVEEDVTFTTSVSTTPSSCGSGDNAPCECEGKMQNLTVQYTGQSGADIEVYNDDNHSILIAAFSNVQNGDILYVDADTLGGEFKSRTYFSIVGGNEIDIHTSCSQDIQGLQIGDYLVIGYTDGEGNSCNNVPCDGSAEIAVNGNTGPYEFIWSTGNAGPLVSTLCPGDYEVTVTDSLMCTKVVSVTIIEQTSDLTINSTIVDAGCNEIAPDQSCDCQDYITSLTLQYDGPDSVDINVYANKNHQDLMQSFTTVRTGDLIVVNGTFEDKTYFEVVGYPDLKIYTTCGVGSKSKKSKKSSGPELGSTVGDFTLIAFTDAQGNSCDSRLCEGHGSINLALSNGNPPYSFTWSTGDTTQDLNGICAGSYSLTIQESSGCSITQTFVVGNEPSPIDLSPTITDAGCDDIPNPPGPCLCEGKMRNLTLQYNGPSGVDIEAYDKSNHANLIAAFSNVQSGDLLFIDGTVLATGNFKSNTFIQIVGGDEVKVHTSCSKDIQGIVIGDFLVVGYTDGEGNVCDNTPCTGSGAIQLSASNGIPPYEFLWSTGDTTSNIEDLCAGTYTVTVSDSTGCIITDTFNVEVEVSTIILSAVVEEAGCNDTREPDGDCPCDGKMTNLTVQYIGQSGVDIEVYNRISNGVLIASYTNVNNGDILFVDASGLSGGDFESKTFFQIVGGNVINIHTSCSQDIQGMTVGDFKVLGYTDGAGNSCNGGPCDGIGSITLTAANGNPPYTYEWSTGDTTENLSDLCAGAYVVTVSDASGCSLIDTFNVEQTSDTIDISAQITPAGCNEIPVEPCPCENELTSITLEYNGPDSVDINAYARNGHRGLISSFSNVQVGDLLVISNPNIAFEKATYLEIVGYPDIKVETSCGSKSGTKSSKSSHSSHSHSKSSGSKSKKKGFGLGETFGDFTLVAFTDSTGNSCGVTACSGSGVISVSANSQYPPYSYNWSTGDTTQTISGLCSGNYEVTVTNAAGCTESQSFELNTQGTSVINEQISICSGDSVLVGGTYQYNAGTYYDTLATQNGCDTVIQTELTVFVGVVNTVDIEICEGDSIFAGGTYQYVSGSYSDTFALADGCDSIRTVNLTVLSSPILTIQQSICEGDSFFAGGGSQTLAGIYYDTLTGSNGCDSIVATELTVLNTVSTIITLNICEGDSVLAGGAYQTTSGTYFDTLIGSNGCDSIISTTLNVSPAIQLSSSQQNISCIGATDGSINLTINGGTPSYFYEWSNGLTTQDISGLAIGQYTVTVSDIFGCSAILQTTLTGPDPLALGATTTPVSCYQGSDGMIDLLVLGGTSPYSFIWSNGESNEDIDSLLVGSYSVTVTDNNGCNATVIVNVIEPAEIAISGIVTDVTTIGGNDGKIDISIMGGTSPYDYQWSNGSSVQDITSLSAGVYTVTVTDDNGCTGTASYTVTEQVRRSGNGTQKMDAGLGEESDHDWKGFELNVYPNPFDNEIVIEFDLKKPDDAKLILRNTFGQEVYSKSIEAVKGHNIQQLSPEDYIVPGVYYLELTVNGISKSVVPVVK